MTNAFTFSLFSPLTFAPLSEAIHVSDWLEIIMTSSSPREKKAAFSALSGYVPLWVGLTFYLK